MPTHYFIVAYICIAILSGCAAPVSTSEQTLSHVTSGEENRDTPNVLFIVADDLGFADISRLGSEIQTPNIDAIADQGILFTRFYASSMCAPSRIMLLTGVDNHRAGLGNMSEFMTANQRGYPGYEGHLNDRVATLPELLKANDYHSYMVGKWHLGSAYNMSARARGFDRSFILLNGAASHYEDQIGPEENLPKAIYREDGELVHSLPKGFFSSRFYTDKLISYIESNRADGKPFFAYAAYTAPHWPLHAPEDVIDSYAGAYDAGYDAVRAARYQKLKELKLIPQEATFPRRTKSVPAWDTLSLEQQQIASREMEVYAAMVADLDTNIGRLIEYLRESNELDNTLIVFLSDNGSDSFSLAKAPDSIARHARSFDNSLENIGHPNSFSFIGPKWANVGEAPFRLYKTMPTEGGIRVPAAIWYPGLNNATNKVNNTSISVMDLVPTVLELAGIEHPGRYRGKEVFTPNGRSLVPILSGAADQVRTEEDVIAVELLGRRAVIKGDWKIVRIPAPAGSDKWELFNLATDIGEQVDLAEKFPARLAELTGHWDEYQQAFGVVLPPPGKLVINPKYIPQR